MLLMPCWSWCADAPDAVDAAVADKCKLVYAHLNGIAWASEFRTVVQRLVILLFSPQMFVIKFVCHSGGEANKIEDWNQCNQCDNASSLEKRHSGERCKGGVCWKLAASPQTLVNWKLPLIWKVAKKKLQACETRGKLIIAACWILVKACQLLMEDPAHKDPSRRHRAKDKLPKPLVPQQTPLRLYLPQFRIWICQSQMEQRTKSTLETN